MSSGLPTTQLRELRAAVLALKQSEQVALAKHHAEDQSMLLHRLREDLKTVAAYESMAEEPFNDRDLNEWEPKVPPIEAIEGTNDLVWYLKQAGDLATPDGLGFKLVDREVSPLRTKGNQRAPRRSVDALLRGESGRPIAAEIKIGGDSLTYVAFIQALMYGVELVSEEQRRRLKKQYESAGFEMDGPYLDLYVIGFDVHTGTHKEASFKATERIAAGLAAKEQFASTFGRIAYLELSVEEGALQVEPLFAHGS